MAKKRRKRRPRAAAPPAPKQRKPVEPAARRTARDEAPQALWGSFPLTELTILVGLVMLVLGFAVASGRSLLLIVVGISLAALGGLELAIREHFAGYRSHSGLLAMACGVLSSALAFAVGIKAFGSVVALIPVAIGAIVFVPAFLALRNAFRRASGGLSFRIGRLKG